MFNAARTFKFWGRTSRLLIPVVLVAALALLTETLTQPLFPLDEFLVESGVSLLGYLAVYIIIVLVIMLFAGRFVAATYNLDGTREGIAPLIRLMFGKPGFGPIAVISGGQIASGQDTVVTKLGGPAGLVIHNDSAVVLEKRGTLSRVVGPGLPVLEPFETVYDVIDLRPKRWLLSVGAMTREGIPVTWDVEIRYQIDDGGQEPTEDRPYPFSEETVFKAATGKWRRERGRTQDIDWEGWVVISQTEGSLRSIIARRNLDELIGLTEEATLAAREAVQNELAGIIREAAPKMGAKLLDLRLQTLQVQDEVTEQWIEAWRARWQGWSTRELAPHEAERIQEYEKAKAEAHILPLNNLTAELQKLEHADQAVILMRLSSILDQGTLGVASRVFFPGQALETVEHIRDILRGPSGSDHQNGAVLLGTTDDNADGDAKSKPQNYPREIIRVLPLFDEIAAGYEKPVVDDVLGYIQQFGELDFEFEGQLLKAIPLRGQKWLTFSKESSYVVVKISGDSMDLAGITTKDYIILQRSSVGAMAPSTSDIVAVVFREEDSKATLKRITINSEGVTLKPESSNPDHQPRKLPFTQFKGDPPPVQIVGIAIAVLKPEDITA